MRIRNRALVNGIVQGVGFRPFVYQLASRHRLGGWVRNCAQGVVIEAEGEPAELEQFFHYLREQAPPLSEIASLQVEAVEPAGERSFQIIESQACPERSRRGQAQPTPVIPPDVALCSRCAAEIVNPADRRFGYPFTNCTDCGPRFTIIQGLPYDRPKTTMSAFRMCPDCHREYRDPADRRFHAEPNACPECGPWLELDGLLDEANEAAREEFNPTPTLPASGEGGICFSPACGGDREGVAERPADPLARAGRLLEEGRILAIKGLGGFHLACDAANPEAVWALRTRKGRSAKPFALMVRDLEVARRLCVIRPEEERLLQSPQSPIVLLEARPGLTSPLACGHPLSVNGEGDGGRGPTRERGTGGEVQRERGGREERSAVAAQVAPANRYLGLMLPYTPLHRLLFEHCPPALVMTSGNLSEEPIAHHNREAHGRLAMIADHFLTHNREIHLPCDDSVVRWAGGELLPIRRSRGYVPRSLPLGFSAPRVLACGGELKNTVCLLVGDRAVLSQHIGDLDNAQTLAYYQRSIAHLQQLFQFQPEVVAHDLHPDYLATRQAFELADQFGVRRLAAAFTPGACSREPRAPRLEAVQHHHAHLASLLVDAGLEGPVIGAIFDGTGYGSDGAIWGGEFLVGGLADFERAAHLEYLPLPGGEAAIRRPYRMALSYLLAAFGDEGQAIGRELLPWLSELEARTVARQIERAVNSPLTSSMGRLFDAASALAGICGEATYEGQAAVELEMAAQGEGQPYPYRVEGKLVSFLPAIRQMVADRRQEVPASEISTRFHATVVAAAVEVCSGLAASTGLRRVALSGGCFQNVRLLESLLDALRRAGLEPVRHRQVPPNDGGLSLGQAAVAAARESMK